MIDIKLNEEDVDEKMADEIDVKRSRYPHCIVWTPIPLLTWFFPFIGHTGICMCNGVIRDFAGPYYVSEDEMAFGWPTKYYQLSLDLVEGGQLTWDRAVMKASDIYTGRMHNLILDNCHSHVAMALNIMKYDNKTNWNMIKIAFRMFFCGKYTNFYGFLKTWLPFLILIGLIVLVVFYFH